MTDPLTRAGLRRAAALVPDGDRLELLPLLAQDPIVAPLPPAVAVQRLMAYLLEPLGRALLAVDDSLAAWFAGSPLLRPAGPGCAVPLADDLAAVLVAPSIARADDLPPVLAKWRWSPRADELVAATVAALPPEAGARALAALRAPGRDEPILHQAALQAGRALAWAPHLHGAPDADAIVDELVALLDRRSPRPLLAALAVSLGPIARARTPLGERVRTHAQAQLAAAVDRLLDRNQPKGFAAQLAALDAPSGSAELARMKKMPDWEHAEWCAHLLGAAAPADAEGFAAWHDDCRGLFAELPLFPAFLDGLVQAAATAPLAQLVIAMAAGDDDDRALGADLSSQLPLDEAEPALLDLCEDSRPDVRVAALRGLSLLGPVAIEPIARRLEDPAPEVAAAAALLLVDLGEAARCQARSDDPNLLRRAAVLAATGANDTDTVGELAVELVGQLDEAESSDDLAASPLLESLAAALFSTPHGLERTAALVGGIPASLPVVALAFPHDDPQSPGVIAPPDALATLDAALAEITSTDTEEAALALGLLAGLACGDAALADRIAAALTHTTGFAGQLLVALSAVRVRSPAAAAALAPLVASTHPLVGRVYAAAAAGRVLPPDHAAWADVTALLDLGTIARAAAWASLRDRLRYT